MIEMDEQFLRLQNALNERKLVLKQDLRAKFGPLGTRIEIIVQMIIFVLQKRKLNGPLSFWTRSFLLLTLLFRI